MGQPGLPFNTTPGGLQIRVTSRHRKLKNHAPIPEGHRVTLDITDDITVHFHELDREFSSGPGHPVYSTYWIAKHFEEVGRKLLLPYREEGEEGVGTSVEVQHLASALPSMRVTHTATVQSVDGRRLNCTMTAVSELGDLIATGSTGQYVTRAEKLERNFQTLRERWEIHQQK